MARSRPSETIRGTTGLTLMRCQRWASSSSAILNEPERGVLRVGKCLHHLHRKAQVIPEGSEVAHSEADRHNSRLSRRSAAGCVLGALSRLRTAIRRKCGTVRDDRASGPGPGWTSVRDLPDRAGTEVGQGSTSPRPPRRACPTSCRRDAGRGSVIRFTYGGRRVDDPHPSGSGGQ